MQNPLLQQQIAYYQARASEYDEWFLRQGRYDHGEEHRRQWWGEVAQVQAALEVFAPTGDVLELASGTGWWTEQLVKSADQVTAVDAAAETIALNRERVGSGKVTYVQTDIFTWKPPHTFDMAFFSFWLSHVPPERFDDFWALVEEAVGPNGRVFFIDSRYNPGATAVDNRLGTPQDTSVTRRLNDGRSFDIVKIFYDPDELTQQLERRGWKAQIQWTEQFFLYGWGERRYQH
jgi:2-polyprenyl-3-methyl-5-hydroxy-6-metoxy-1,4-benzoquinol methylase